MERVFPHESTLNKKGSWHPRSSSRVVPLINCAGPYRLRNEEDASLEMLQRSHANTHDIRERIALGHLLLMPECN